MISRSQTWEEDFGGSSLVVVYDKKSVADGKVIRYLTELQRRGDSEFDKIVDKKSFHDITFKCGSLNVMLHPGKHGKRELEILE